MSSFGYSEYIPFAVLVAALIIGGSVLRSRAGEVRMTASSGDERSNLETSGNDRARFLTDYDPAIVNVPAADAEMDAAIAHARDTLAMFWASYDAPKPTEYGHCLKVRFAGDGYVEHIWMADIVKLANGHYSGRFGNDPDNLPGKHMFDEAEFDQAGITDWMFMRNEKIVGGETIKLLLNSMPKEEAAAMRERME